MGDSRSRVEERRRKAGREGTQDKRRVSGELIVAQKDLSPSHRKKERNQPKHNAEKNKQKQDETRSYTKREYHMEIFG